MEWFALLPDVYKVCLAVVMVFDLWLLWSSYKIHKQLEQLDRGKDARFRNLRMVEKEFLKV